MVKVIGLSGVARVGKDTLFNSLSALGGNKNYTRMAFADELKYECDEFLKRNVNISAFTEDDNEKALIRPFLVTYGSHLRRRINKRCWVEKVEAKILKMTNLNSTVFITDVRYQNEMEWIQNTMGGKIIYITRDGVLPANDEEKNNDPGLRSMADVILDLPNFPTNSLNDDCINFLTTKTEEIL